MKSMMLVLAAVTATVTAAQPVDLFIGTQESKGAVIVRGPKWCGKATMSALSPVPLVA